MNYKERANYYCQMADRWERGEQLLLNGDLRIQDTLREAATVIETLLEERDVAKNRCCENCMNKGDKFVCRACFRSCGREDCWEWKGPQKGEIENGN